MATVQQALVGLIMGSQSDWETMQHTAAQLDELAIGKAGAINAALLAIAILGNKYPEFRLTYDEFRRKQTATVLANPKPPPQATAPRR